jgi:hypothetical protein
MGTDRQHYRSFSARLKPATRAAMYRRRRRGTEERGSAPSPDLRYAIIEPVINRITPGVHRNIRLHLAAGVSLSMPVADALDITRFAIHLLKIHRAFAAPQISSDWSLYVQSGMRDAGLS